MKPEYRSLQPARQAVILLFLVVGAWYLNWRLETFNAAHPVFSWLLYGAEVFGFFTAVLNIFMTWRLSERTAPPPALGLKVDVFIPTYNEDVEMVRRTALARTKPGFWTTATARRCARWRNRSACVTWREPIMRMPRRAISITHCRTARRT
ncbi:MAG: hypothetical protein ABS92_08520 [Thiobacillus sp. SCN 63-374]|nr:MAG: hypothetical protein ABS92_08520 [Thiobacillus sp. SCN 63-374]